MAVVSFYNMMIKSSDFLSINNFSELAAAVGPEEATRNTGVHFRNQSPKAAAFEDYTKCMLQLEEYYYQEFFPQYTNAQQPFPISVMIVDDHVYVIMSLHVTTNPQWWKNPSTTYACNGINGGTVLYGRRKVARTLVVKRPQNLSVFP